MPPPSSLTDLLVLFALSVLVVVAFHRARVPSIVGFLITGVLAGPYGFGLIRNVAEVQELAEIGVLLLLFTVGLEFSLEQLSRLRAFLLAGGGLQVSLTLGATAVAARAAGLPLPVAIFVGMLVALSSTAIVLRLLSDRAELDTPYGKAALGILIFQDLCIVPMVLVTPVLGGRAGGSTALVVGLVKAAVFIGGALVAARIIVPRILTVVAATRRREIFLLTIVLLCLGAAWASARVGLSLALGAFIAGLVVSESEFSYQALGEVLPLREVFNSLFFMSIGMLFDARTLLASPVLVLGAIAGVVVLKAVITGGVSVLLGQSVRVAVVAGLSLAQIGEFSFVLSRSGAEAGLLSERLDQLFLAVAVGTMAVTPALIALAPRLARLAEGRLPLRWVGRGYGVESQAAVANGPTDHVVIVGFGFNGRNLARVLKDVEIPYVVVEMNPLLVRGEQRRGERIIYGDAASPVVLEHAGVDHARVLVIAISDAAATRSVVTAARRLNPRVHIVVRARYVQEMQTLLALGTNEVVPEEFETSIEVFARVLRRYLVPREVIESRVREIRHEHYEMFRPLPDAATRVEEIGRFLSDVTLAVVRVDDGSPAAGTPLAELRLRERTGTTIVAIQRRGGGLVVSPSGPETLETGDSVLLFGGTEELAKAASVLRGGDAA